MKTTGAVVYCTQKSHMRVEFEPAHVCASCTFHIWQNTLHSDILLIITNDFVHCQIEAQAKGRYSLDMSPFAPAVHYIWYTTSCKRPVTTLQNPLLTSALFVWLPFHSYPTPQPPKPFMCFIKQKNKITESEILKPSTVCPVSRSPYPRLCATTLYHIYFS